MTNDPLYQSDRGRFIPSPMTTGPWSSESQHGGPPSALVAHLIERYDNGELMFLARLTAEMLRPIPIAALTASIRTVRPGRKVQLIEVSLWDGRCAGEGTEVFRATGLRLRRADLVFPPESSSANDAFDAEYQTIRPVGRPDDGTAWFHRPNQGTFGHDGFHSGGVELRFLDGYPNRLGPGIMWGRLLGPVLDDLEPTGVVRAVAMADFGNAVSSVVDPTRFTYLNTDLTVSLSREPRGEWIALDAITRISRMGLGVASAGLYDRNGPIGRSAASLLIEPRAGLDVD